MQISIKLSHKAKRWRLSVNRSNEVVLTIPKGFSQKDADNILQTHSNWIEKITNRQKSQLERTQNIYKERFPLLPLLGDWVKIDGEKEQFYRKKAKEFFINASDLIASDLGVKYSKITIRDQKTRFGSYSSSGTLSYNWRVIKAPIEVAHYLAAHECAHILHPNHGAKFWQTVEAISPNFRSHEAWLRANVQFLRFDPWR